MACAFNPVFLLLAPRFFFERVFVAWNQLMAAFAAMFLQRWEIKPRLQ
jgi:hypothetical protein